MDRQRWMVICGIVAIGLYSLSWIMQLAEIPGKGWVRLSALIPFLIGAGILLYDRAMKAKAQGRSNKGKTGWEDILGEDEPEGNA
jgi:CHASE2 domain-containing sensor protein